MRDLPIFLDKPETIDKKDLGIDGKTIGQMLRRRAETTPHRIAYRSKRNGVWENTTWAEAYLKARHIAWGLLAQGIQIGDRIAILSGTKEEWTLCDQGILLAGGVTVPLYPSTPAEGCAYILSNSESIIAFVEDEKQLTKLQKIRNQLPQLRKIVLFSTTTPQGDNWVVNLSELNQQGAQYGADNGPSLEFIEEKQTGSSIATIAYTSGTTGEPKGAIITHDAFTIGTRYALSAVPAEINDTQLFFLPLSHSFAHMISIFAIRLGFCTAFAESTDKLIENIAEIRPTCMLAVPRVFEKVYKGFLQKIHEGSHLKQSLAKWALAVGSKVSKELQQGQSPKGWLAWKYEIADHLVFRKLRQRLGGQIRWFISGSAPLSPEINEFFHGAGMMILEGYGLTETNSITTVNRMHHFRFGTVGQSHHPSLEIRIATDGEILTKGITNFLGYYKMPEATKEAIDEQGWFHTGDIGELDSEGFLKITDRKKDLIKTSGGKFVAPQMLEGLLKFHPLVSQAVVVGDRHQYITALLSLNQESAQTWLEQKLGAPISKEQVITHPALLGELENHLAQLNRRLGSWEQIKYFRLLPRELTEAQGEVTPSLKIKRKVVLERYKDLIDSMYTEALTAGHSHAFL